MLTEEKGFRRVVRSLAVPVSVIGTLLAAQTHIDFPQQVKGLPSVVMIQRSVCIQTPAPGATGGDCTGLELYRLLFADGTQRVMVGIPDDGKISTDIKWTPVALTPPGTSTAVGLGQIRLK